MLFGGGAEAAEGKAQVVRLLNNRSFKVRTGTLSSSFVRLRNVILKRGIVIG